VRAAKNSTVTQQYTYQDQQTLPGANFYRLKMVDQDGKTTYSKVAMIRARVNSKGLQVYPNPAYSDLQVHTTLQGRLRLAIYDSKGAVVKEMTIKGEGAATVWPVDVSDLNKGAYQIKVYHAQGAQTTSFIKL